MTFAERLQQLIAVRDISYRSLATRVYYSKSYIFDLAAGRKQPTAEVATRLDEALDAEGYVDCSCRTRLWG